MDKFSRAQRRHDRARIRNAREFYWSYTRQEPMSAGSRNAVIDTPHPCSGWCCGNPRRWFGDRSLSEQRFHAERLDGHDRDL
jgi:hypothetical protein